ncbi:MAG: hypothetical protein OHK0013_46980 [Sandaracinaceae bacterium]
MALAAVALSSALALASGCARTTLREEDAAVELPDAWARRDAGRLDAGRDGGRDAGRDAGPPDAYVRPDADERVREDETGFCRIDGTCMCNDPTWGPCGGAWGTEPICRPLTSMTHCGACFHSCWRCDAPGGLCACDAGRCAPASVLAWWPLGVLVGRGDGPTHFRSFFEFHFGDRERGLEGRPDSVRGYEDLVGWAFIEGGRLFSVRRRIPHEGIAPPVLLEELSTDGRVERIGRYVQVPGIVVLTDVGVTNVFASEARSDGSIGMGRTGLVGPPLDPASVRELYAEPSAIYALLVDGRVVVFGRDSSGLIDPALSALTWTPLPFPRSAVSIGLVPDDEGPVLCAALDDGTVWVAGRPRTWWFDDPPSGDLLRRVEPMTAGRVTRLIPQVTGQLCLEGPDYPGGVYCPLSAGEEFPFTTVPATAVELDRRHEWDGICRRYRMEDGYEEILCTRMWDWSLRPGLERRWTNRP